MEGQTVLRIASYIDILQSGNGPVADNAVHIFSV